MSDYIKREDAIEAVRCYMMQTGIAELPYTYAKDEIFKVPSADVVEVVRCKDCKYNPRNPRSWDDDDIVEHYLWYEFMAIESKYNYCSKGKRF